MQRYPDLGDPQGQKSSPSYQQPMLYPNNGIGQSQQFQQSHSSYQQPMLYPNVVGQAYSPAQNYMKENFDHYKAQERGLQKLQGLNGIFIKQKLEVLEAVTGCETENKYYVYELDQAGDKKGKKLFKCKERSSCCARQCLSGDCRPFRMEISYATRGDDDDDYEPFLHLERPCKCTCLCFQRPEVMVTLVEDNKDEFLGKIVDPWRCCDIGLNVYDSSKAKKYMIEGDCCQLGLWCKCPCESCETINFDVKSVSGKAISNIQKRPKGCCKEMVSDADNFVLNFPNNATLEDKALLMSAVLFIDFRHFETSQKDRTPDLN